MKANLFSRTLLPVLAGVLLAAPAAAAGSENLWTVLSASGSVEFTHDQAAEVAWESVVRGARLTPSATIRTGDDGRATLSLGRSVILIDPDSSLELPGLTEDGHPMRVFQEQGSAMYDIHKGRRHHFQVVTPYLVAGVKGTVFQVTVDDRASAVTVREGVVEVFTLRSDLGVDVHAGQEVHLDALPGARPRLLPAAEATQERLSLMSRIGRQEEQRARRDGTLPRPETAWPVPGGFLAKEPVAGADDLEPRRADGDDGLLGAAGDDEAGGIDNDLTRELEKEYRELEERTKQLLDPVQEVPQNQPQSGGVR